MDLNEDSDVQSGDSRSVSENEDEDEEMDEEGSGEFFDVLDVFDGRADVENDDDPPPKSDKKLQDVRTKTVAEDKEEWGGAGDADEGMDGDEPEDDEEEEEEDSAVDEDDELRISASDSEEPSPKALDDLETFLSNLDPAAPQKRKTADEAESVLKKRRRVIDRTEAGEESEFGVRGTGMHRCHAFIILIPIQVRILSSWMTFLLRSRLPLPSQLSRNRQEHSHQPVRKQKRSLHRYHSEHKNVSIEKLHMKRQKKR